MRLAFAQHVALLNNARRMRVTRALAAIITIALAMVVRLLVLAADGVVPLLCHVLAVVRHKDGG